MNVDWQGFLHFMVKVIMRFCKRIKNVKLISNLMQFKYRLKVKKKKEFIKCFFSNGFTIKNVGT